MLSRSNILSIMILVLVAISFNVLAVENPVTENPVAENPVVEYQSGHGALELFDDAAMQAAPQWIKYWMGVMGVSFVLGLLFIRTQPIARWVVGGFLLTLITVMGLAPALGIPVLAGFIGLCHLIYWSPGLFMLLKQRPFLATRSAFSIWSGLITAVILFSFIFDIRDAVIYLGHLIAG